MGGNGVPYIETSQFVVGEGRHFMKRYLEDWTVAKTQQLFKVLVYNVYISMVVLSSLQYLFCWLLVSMNVHDLEPRLPISLEVRISRVQALHGQER